VTEAVGCGQLA